MEKNSICKSISFVLALMLILTCIPLSAINILADGSELSDKINNFNSDPSLANADSVMEIYNGLADKTSVKDEMAPLLEYVKDTYFNDDLQFVYSTDGKDLLSQPYPNITRYIWQGDYENVENTTANFRTNSDVVDATDVKSITAVYDKNKINQNPYIGNSIFNMFSDLLGDDEIGTNNLGVQLKEINVDDNSALTIDPLPTDLPAPVADYDKTEQKYKNVWKDSSVYYTGRSNQFAIDDVTGGTLDYSKYNSLSCIAFSYTINNITNVVGDATKTDAYYNNHTAIDFTVKCWADDGDGVYDPDTDVLVSDANVKGGIVKINYNGDSPRVLQFGIPKNVLISGVLAKITITTNHLDNNVIVSNIQQRISEYNNNPTLNNMDSVLKYYNLLSNSAKAEIYDETKDFLATVKTSFYNINAEFVYNSNEIQDYPNIINYVFNISDKADTDNVRTNPNILDASKIINEKDAVTGGTIIFDKSKVSTGSSVFNILSDLEIGKDTNNQGTDFGFGFYEDQDVLKLGHLPKDVHTNGDIYYKSAGYGYHNGSLSSNWTPKSLTDSEIQAYANYDYLAVSYTVSYTENFNGSTSDDNYTEMYFSVKCWADNGDGILQNGETVLTDFTSTGNKIRIKYYDNDNEQGRETRRTIEFGIPKSLFTSKAIKSLRIQTNDIPDELIARTFSEKYTELISKDVSSVTVEDFNTIQEAIDEYNLLSQDIKNLLTVEYNKLTSLYKASIESVYDYDDLFTGETFEGNTSIINNYLEFGSDTTSKPSDFIQKQTDNNNALTVSNINNNTLTVKDTAWPDQNKITHLELDYTPGDTSSRVIVLADDGTQAAGLKFMGDNGGLGLFYVIRKTADESFGFDSSTSNIKKIFSPADAPYTINVDPTAKMHLKFLIDYTANKEIKVNCCITGKKIVSDTLVDFMAKSEHTFTFDNVIGQETKFAFDTTNGFTVDNISVASTESQTRHFKKANSYILNKTVSTVNQNDLDAYDNAVSEYLNYSDCTKDLLVTEKTLLDDMDPYFAQILTSAININSAWRVMKYIDGNVSYSQDIEDGINYFSPKNDELTLNSEYWESGRRPDVISVKLKSSDTAGIFFANDSNANVKLGIDFENGNNCRCHQDKIATSQNGLYGQYRSQTSVSKSKSFDSVDHWVTIDMYLDYSNLNNKQLSITYYTRVYNTGDESHTAGYYLLGPQKITYSGINNMNDFRLCIPSSATTTKVASVVYYSNEDIAPDVLGSCISKSSGNLSFTMKNKDTHNMFKDFASLQTHEGNDNDDDIKGEGITDYVTNGFEPYSQTSFGSVILPQNMLQGDLTNQTEKALVINCKSDQNTYKGQYFVTINGSNKDNWAGTRFATRAFINYNVAPGIITAVYSVDKSSEETLDVTYYSRSLNKTRRLTVATELNKGTSTILDNNDSVISKSNNNVNDVLSSGKVSMGRIIEFLNKITQ